MIEVILLVVAVVALVVGTLVIQIQHYHDREDLTATLELLPRSGRDIESIDSRRHEDIVDRLMETKLEDRGETDEQG